MRKMFASRRLPRASVRVPPRLQRVFATATAAMAARAEPVFTVPLVPVLGASITAATVATVLAYERGQRSALQRPDFQPDVLEAAEDETLINWSGTHQVTSSRYYTPTSAGEVAAVVARCHEQGLRVRPVGAHLSPNGIAFSEDGMVDLALLDRIKSVDSERLQVTVEAGCRIQQLLDALRPFGLTLENIASIKQQQIAGFAQVGAHGTGATIPPCDMQVVAMKMATPAHGVVSLSEHENRELFHMARVGLGCLGVVTEVTLQCVPMHSLQEHTVVLSHAEVARRRDELVNGHRHARFMWIPYTQDVVVVYSDPVPEHTKQAKPDHVSDEPVRQRALRELYRRVRGGEVTEEEVAGLSFADLRDLLLANGAGPLDTQYVKEINRAEAEYWRQSTGVRVAPSDQVLAFDCGGQQWVYEVAFPLQASSSAGHTDGRDVEFVRELLWRIEEQGIPAPGPIEQRWTARSTSRMSPAHSEDPTQQFSWVGIIMYLPTADGRLRRRIANEFRNYCRVLNDLCDEFGAVGHWAKIETQALTRDERVRLQQRLARRYDVAAFERVRAALDPKKVLVNDVVGDCLGIDF